MVVGLCCLLFFGVFVSGRIVLRWLVFVVCCLLAVAFSVLSVGGSVLFVRGGLLVHVCCCWLRFVLLFSVVCWLFGYGLLFVVCIVLLLSVCGLLSFYIVFSVVGCCMLCDVGVNFLVGRWLLFVGC